VFIECLEVSAECLLDSGGYTLFGLSNTGR